MAMGRYDDQTQTRKEINKKERLKDKKGKNE